MGVIINGVPESELDKCVEVIKEELVSKCKLEIVDSKVNLGLMQAHVENRHSAGEARDGYYSIIVTLSVDQLNVEV